MQLRHEGKIVDWDIKQQQKLSYFKLADEWCRCNMYISLKDFFFELGVRIIKIHLGGRYIVCFKVANISLWINTGMNIN